MKYGFVKVAAAIPGVKVADCKFNAQQIDTQIAIADGKGVQIIVFPELCITGYSCADLFGQTLLLEDPTDGHHLDCRDAGCGQLYLDELCGSLTERKDTGSSSQDLSP